MTRTKWIVVVVVVVLLVGYDYARWQQATTNAHTRPAGMYFPGAGFLGPAPEARA